jgi:hypothetical protein
MQKQYLNNKETKIINKQNNLEIILKNQEALHWRSHLKICDGRYLVPFHWK